MVETIRKYFSELPDPRHRRGRRHRLDEMIIMAILAVICSADSWQEVAHFARAKEKWLRSFLELPHGVPSHDTFGRVFSVLEPEAFERCFLAWIGALAQRPAGGQQPQGGHQQGPAVAEQRAHGRHRRSQSTDGSLAFAPSVLLCYTRPMSDL